MRKLASLAFSINTTLFSFNSICDDTLICRKNFFLLLMYYHPNALGGIPLRIIYLRIKNSRRLDDEETYL